MPIGTAFHERTFALCESLNYREWSGYYTVSAYETHHDHEYNAIRNAAALIDISPLFKYRLSGPDATRPLHIRPDHRTHQAGRNDENGLPRLRQHHRPRVHGVEQGLHNSEDKGTDEGTDAGPNNLRADRVRGFCHAPYCPRPEPI